MPSRPKKSESLEVRLPHALKQAFMSRCRENGRSASEVVRDMIEAYVARPEPLPSPEPQPMPRIRILLPGAMAATALAAGVLAATATSAGPDLREIFRTLDRDGNGAVTLAEFSSSSHADVAARIQKGSMASAHAVIMPLARAHGAAAGDRPPFGAVDQDGDGQLTYPEFAGHHRQVAGQVFSGLDRDRNGALSREEFAAAGASQPAALRDHLSATFARLDGDGDGSVTRTEFDLH